MTPAEIVSRLHAGDPRATARAISWMEDDDPRAGEVLAALDRQRIDDSLFIGLTGPPGAGKSTLTSRLVSRCRTHGRRVGIIAVDPSSSLTGGAVLGDRIRMMRHALDDDVLIRSMASRGRLGGLCAAAAAAARIMAASGCFLVIIETVGVGQLEMDIAGLADITVLVLAPGLGDEIQAMKAGILEVADLLVVNKADLAGSDKLLMDLEAIVPHRDMVHATVAATGQGVEELSVALERLDEQQRASGRLRQKRATAALAEVVDHALDLLRPRLRDLAAARPATVEPRELALDLVRQLLTGKKV